MLRLSSTENICDAKHGWCIPTHHALCHGLALECQLANCDKRCLEGPGTGGVWLLGHVKIKMRKDGIDNTLAIWHDAHAPKARASVGSSVALSLRSAVDKAGSAAWAYDHQWQLERKLWHINLVKLFVFFILSETKTWHSRCGTLTWINACWRTAIRFNPKTHDTCDAQLRRNVKAAACERNSQLLIVRLRASRKPWRQLLSKLISALREGCSIIGECCEGPGYIMQIDHRRCVHWTLWVGSRRCADGRTGQILFVWDGFALKLRGVSTRTHSS